MSGDYIEISEAELRRLQDRAVADEYHLIRLECEATRLAQEVAQLKQYIRLPFSKQFARKHGKAFTKKVRAALSHWKEHTSNST